MNHFSVLLVDDEVKRYLSPAVALFEKPFRVTLSVPQIGNTSTHTIEVSDVFVDLKVAKNLNEATVLIRSHFFHLAMVDPRLHLDRDDLLEGNILLKRLKELRPSCERVIHTDLGRNLAEGAEIIVNELDPLDGNAKHLVTKNLHRYLHVIKNRAAFWMLYPITVNKPRMVVDMLIERFHKRKKSVDVDITSDEIDFLVSSIFGQGKDWSQFHGGIGIERVELSRFIDQGFSLAAVVRATGFSKEGLAGISCVLKFANRDYVGKELAGYSQYVRFRVDVHYRVELLAWEFGDKFGVLCYNFAGVTSLTKQFLLGNQGGTEESFFHTLERLFDPNGKKWYKESHKMSLENYFYHDPYYLDVVDVKHKITFFAKTLYSNCCLTNYTGGEMIIYGANIGIPRDLLNHALNKSIFSDTLDGCIVHGDLHCDNVLIDKDGTPMCIDYSTVNQGPRAIDFATLEASTRFLYLKRLAEDGTIDDDPRTDDQVIPELLALVSIEDDIWKAVWLTGGTSTTPVPRPFWVQASIKIGSLAKENFTKIADNDAQNITMEEYAATCLMWAFRLFRIEKMSYREKTRIFIWILSLARMLNYQADSA